MLAQRLATVAVTRLLVGSFATLHVVAKLRWHVDYLLEQPEATLSEVVIIQSPLRLEHALATHIRLMPDISIIAPHLGAQDCRDSTHLLRLRNRDALFAELQQAIPAMLLTITK